MSVLQPAKKANNTPIAIAFFIILSPFRIVIFIGTGQRCSVKLFVDSALALS
jgi:hypothetical protein